MTIKGQTKAEYQKNYTRVKDIVEKSKGDLNIQKNLALRQANLITDEHKAINRALAARELGYKNIFDVFFRRAYELGAVKTLDYREYVLSMLLESDAE
jgi:hypothetical protein